MNLMSMAPMPMSMPPMSMPPMSIPPMAMPPMHQQPHRFFHNNNSSFNGMNGNFNNQNRFRPSHYNQRPTQVQPPLQQQLPGPNPFIPLQASRKATKTKNNQVEAKKPPVEQVVVQKKEVATKPEASLTVAAAVNLNSSQPAVDNRKCRLAISFGK